MLDHFRYFGDPGVKHAYLRVFREFYHPRPGHNLAVMLNDAASADGLVTGGLTGTARRQIAATASLHYINWHMSASRPLMSEAGAPIGSCIFL